MHAIVVYSRKKRGGGAAAAPDAGEVGSRLSDFYLDSVVVGSELDAQIRLEAARLHLAQQHGQGDIWRVFLAPITAGFRGLIEPLRVGDEPTRFNVWMMRRDGLDGTREYEIKMVKVHVSDGEPEHDKQLWACTKIGEDWQRPDHLARYAARQRTAEQRRAALSSRR